MWGMLLCTFAGILNVFTNHMISECASRVGRPCGFKELAHRAHPRLSVAVDLAVIISCLGAGCSYIIVATDCFRLVGDPHGPRWCWTLLAAAIVTPPSYLRTLDSLRFTSTIAVVCLVLIVTVIILFSMNADAEIIDPCPVHGFQPVCCLLAHTCVQAMPASVSAESGARQGSTLHPL